MRGVITTALLLSLAACSSAQQDSGGGGAGGGSSSGNTCPAAEFESARCGSPWAMCKHLHGPTSGVCVGGYWKTVLPAVAPAPFPEQGTCNPFGVWKIQASGNANAPCIPDDFSRLIVHRASGGQVYLALGQVSYAEVSADGCKVIADTHKAYNGETTMYRLDLDFGLAVPKGKLRLDQLGLVCSGSETFTATASLLEQDG